MKYQVSEKQLKAMDEAFTYIPEHMRDGVVRYLENGIEPGGFMMGVLTNNLKAACMCADSINRNHIISIVAWFWNYAPAQSWGRLGAVNEWKALLGEEV